MLVSFFMFGALICYWLLVKKGNVKKPPKGVFLILFFSIALSVFMFLMENAGGEIQSLERKSQGEGSLTEELEVEISGEERLESLQVEVAEQEYTSQEIQEVFADIMEKLDQMILGENASFDRIEEDLNLVSAVEPYPVFIEWEMDSYEVLDVEGKIREENLSETGTLVEVRGTLSYLEEQAFYQRSVMVYPKTLTGTALLRKQVEEALFGAEESTRTESEFALPNEVEGAALSWRKTKTNTGYYLLCMGVGLAAFLIYREKEQEKKEIIKRQNELIREYPGMVSKITMLLGTGMTVRGAWEKIVQSYEKQKESLGEKIVYEEMNLTLREIQGGIPEGEAYERFGKRCEITMYLKFGAMLSQNLRKGSRGISDLLRVEAIQSFENRKSLAKRQGEEAGTKLLMPMIGMLAVVLIMVIVPAFLSMQF